MNINPDQNHRILVIDDNKHIHEDFRKILTPQTIAGELAEIELSLFASAGAAEPENDIQDFQIDSAFQGREGLALVERSLGENRPYALIFVDVRMPPGWDGIETTAKIWEADPRVQIVLCTAYSDYSWNEMRSRLGISDRLVILKKPFDNIEVLQLAHALVAKWCLHGKARMQTDEMERLIAARTLELQAANEKLKTEMAERVRVEETLRQAQKMEALGQLAGGVAHDFNNLLTVIRGYTDVLLSMKTQTPDAVKALRDIRYAADRAATLTSQMLTFSRKKAVQRANLNLNYLIKQSTDMLKRLLGENVSMEVQENPEPLPVYADPVMMEQIILNLAVNARDAMPEGGRVRICADEVEIGEEQCRQNSQARPGNFARLTVSDSGCGIAPEVFPRLFEPFFTTKAPGKGTGMGLATVYAIVQQHDGWVEVESEPGKGAEFRVFLPANRKPSPRANQANPKPKTVGGKETILLVEDEDLVRRITAQILQKNGYCVFEAASSQDALSTWEARRQEIDLFLTDIVLPGDKSGCVLAKKFLGEKQKLKVAYMTGYGVNSLAADCQPAQDVNFLQKPYSVDSLLTMVRHCLDEP